MYKFVFLTFFSLFLVGCAQMESIEGGAVDRIPPRVVQNGIKPQNESTHFSAKKIEFRFQEFIQLNNPTQTISVIPNDIEIEAEVKGKSLILNLKGDLQENTTYLISMNGAVKDFTESNDSLMQYVFSTGDFIDSLTYSGFVVDAKELTPVKNCFVGLYDLSDSAIYKKPLYYASTNDQGQFTFKYLKKGTFQIYAFEDENKDSKWQKTERMAFIDKPISVDTNQADTLHLHVFKNQVKTKLTARYIFPSKFVISSNNLLDLHALNIDKQDIPLDSIYWYSKDSLSVISTATVENQHIIAVEYMVDDSLYNDTLRVRVPMKKKGLKPTYEVVNSQNSYENNELIVFSFSDNIKAVDTSKMELVVYDTIKLPLQATFENNYLTFHLDGLKGKRFQINGLEKAITFENFTEDFSFTRQFDITDLTALGTLILDFSKLPENAIVEMLKDNKVIQTISIAKSGNKLTIPKLQPAMYQFKAFLDEIGDEVWTTGDFLLGRQPEKVLRFSEGVQVRSNWEIEATLEPLTDEK